MVSLTGQELSGLAKRGIAKAAQEMGWQPYKYQGQDGYAYPVLMQDDSQQFRLSEKPLRWKNADSQGDPKYIWLGKKSDNASSLYYSRWTEEAIKRTGGMLYITEGEVDLLSMHAGGIYNVITWLGGGNSIPADLMVHLLRLGVKEIRYVPDLDDTGRQSAIKVAQLAAEAGIHYIALQLPEGLGEKGDVNDLWKHCEFDAFCFREVLDSLPEMVIQEDSWQEPVRPLGNQHEQSAQDKQELPPAFLQAIEQRLGVKGYKQNGWSENVCCPFHEDKNPSAGWNHEKGILKCFGCNPGHDTFYLAKEVGKQLGLNLKDYYTDQRPSKKKTQKVSGSRSESGGEGQSEPNKQRKATHDELGDCVIAQWGDTTKFIDGTWYRYADGIWNKVDKFVIEREIWEIIKAHKNDINPTRNAKDSILDYVERFCHISGELANQQSSCISLRNGVFNYDTFSFEPHRPDRYLLYSADYAFDPVADCPKWRAFLSQVVVRLDGKPDEEMIQLIQEAVGYSMTIDTRQEAMFCLVGKPASGKTTILRILKELAGQMVQEINLNMLQKEFHQLVEIRGKRVIICSEASVNGGFNEAIIKQLVSGESIIARGLYQQPKTFQAQAKIWWAMNELPTNLDTSGAIGRRLRIIPFHQSIPADQRDLNLIDALTAELSGIFNWAMEGLKRLQQNGRLTYPEQTRQAVAEYEIESDPFQQFFIGEDEQWLTFEDEQQTAASELYIAYTAWCKRYGYRPMSLKKFGQRMVKAGYKRHRNNQGMIYRGIGLMPVADKIVDNQRKKDGEKN